MQADLKTAFAFGVYAQTAVTAVTVQNTRGVAGVHAVPLDTVRAQIEACLSDIGADAIKTGMLGYAGLVRMVADELAARAPDIPLVVDPVMVAKGGAWLIDGEAVAALKQHLLPRARLVTPNLPEAVVLTGQDVSTPQGLQAALAVFAGLGCRHVLFKGGHATGPVVQDVLGDCTTGAMLRFEAPRQHTPHTHGTGCTLASAIACGLAEGLKLEDAVRRAHGYVQRAIAAAPGLGTGHGPLSHWART